MFKYLISEFETEFKLLKENIELDIAKPSEITEALSELKELKRKVEEAIEYLEGVSVKLPTPTIEKKELTFEMPEYETEIETPKSKPPTPEVKIKAPFEIEYIIQKGSKGEITITPVIKKKQ